MSKSGFTFGAAPVKRKGRKVDAKFRKEEPSTVNCQPSTIPSFRSATNNAEYTSLSYQTPG
jgi:hypothetical protein